MPKVVVTKNSLPQILNMINTWDGKLTWDLLCKEIAISLDINMGVRRQSLSSYKDIQHAYNQRKTMLKARASQPAFVETNANVTIEHLRRQITFLEVEVERLTNLNEANKQRFLKWQYNAYLHGVRITSLDDAPIDNSELKKLQDMLEKPLTEVNRRKVKEKGGQ